MKINIKNLLFQPLALHLAAGGEGLHLSARECREILTEHISEEIRLAAERGLVSLLKKAIDPVDSPAGNSPKSPKTAVSEPAKVEEPKVKQKKGIGR